MTEDLERVGKIIKINVVYNCRNTRRKIYTRINKVYIYIVANIYIYTLNKKNIITACQNFFYQIHKKNKQKKYIEK